MEILMKRILNMKTFLIISLILIFINFMTMNTFFCHTISSKLTLFFNTFMALGLGGLIGWIGSIDLK